LQVQRVCESCGELFDVDKKVGRFPKFCELGACRRAGAAKYARDYYARKRAEGAPARQTSRTVSCTGCGKTRLAGGSESGGHVCQECRAAASFKAGLKFCDGCGEATYRRGRNGKRFCERCANLRRVQRLAAKNRARRALVRGLPFERYTLAEVAELSCYVCGICGGIVDMGLSGLVSMGPNVDHITPISKGGGDVRENVRLSHRSCNLRRGNREEVEAA